MTLRNWYCVVVMVIAVVLPSQVCFGFDDGDFQYWATAKARFDINKDWYGTVEEEFRLGDDAKKLYYRYTEMGIVYNGLADWLSLGFNYRQVSERKGNGDWIWENRPHFNLTFKGKLGDLVLSDRSRFEYRDKYNAKDMWRYRNKFTVKFPWKLTPLKLKPYVADEIFIDLDQSGINRNRFYSGFSLKLSKNLLGNICYLWQASSSEHQWNDIHVLGTQLEFRF